MSGGQSKRRPQQRPTGQRPAGQKAAGRRPGSTPAAGGRPAEPPTPNLRHDLWAAATVATLVASFGVFLLWGWVDNAWAGVVLVLCFGIGIAFLIRKTFTKYLRHGGSGGAFAVALTALGIALLMLVTEF